jgi:hypothetical protein
MQHVQPEQTAIQGLIIPVDWDDRGNVIAIAISTFDEDEYLINMDEMGKELMGYLREEIEISGQYLVKSGKEMIRVVEYEVKKRSRSSII